MTQNSVVLIFAYHFPPENVIGAARPFRFYRYLAKRGITCRVFTPVPGSGGFSPDTEEIPDPFFTSPQHDLGWQLERGARRFLYPGALGLRWSMLACAAAQRFLRSHPDSKVTAFSTFPPIGAHFAAWQLSRRGNIPWIADFRDPVEEQYRVVRAVKLEKRVVEAATLTIANTDTAAERMRTLYPEQKDKIHFIWNGFDPEKRLQAQALPPRDYKLLSHVGELYTGRTVAPLLESVARLIERGRLSPQQLRIYLGGAASAGSLPSPETLQRAQQQGWLDLRLHSIDRDEATQVATTSDGLLLIQPQSTVQVPGKLFEYLQIGRPTLAFLAEASPSERILKQSGIPYRCLYPTSTPEAWDENILEFLKLPSAACSSPWFEENFNAEKQAALLSDLIDLAHSRR